jgi:hypothetical protein
MMRQILLKKMTLEPTNLSQTKRRKLNLRTNLRLPTSNNLLSVRMISFRNCMILMVQLK